MNSAAFVMLPSSAASAAKVVCVPTSIPTTCREWVNARGLGDAKAQLSDLHGTPWTSGDDLHDL